MKAFLPPKLAEYACIVPDGIPSVGAVISSYFNATGTYFPVFVFPNIDMPYSEETNSRDDGFIAHVMGSHSAVFINNAIARLKPKKIFFAGLTAAQKSYLGFYLPKKLILEVDSTEDLTKLSGYATNADEGTVACRSTELIQGLMLAEFTGRRLTIDDAASQLPTKQMHSSEGLVLIESDQGTMSYAVAALNYACSIGADVALIPSFERAEIHSLQRLIYEWKNNNSIAAYDQLKRKLKERGGDINFREYRFATFFTAGFPYGVMLKNVIPITHVFARPQADLFIFNNIRHEASTANFDGALVFSPKLFKDEETEDVIALLQRNNFHTRALLEKAATINAFTTYAGHYPYDLLHICSHGGETDGYYVIQEFSDRNGTRHKVEYEEIVGFSPAGKDKVSVARKAIFRRLDGLAGMSKELEGRNLPSYVFEDMRKALFHDEDSGKTTRVRLNSPIYSSCHVECYDSIHQGDFHSIAAHSSPLIFNNTCSSWHEIALTFIAAGARGYIGTVWKVSNTVALEAAKIFYEKLGSGDSVLDAFSAMTGSIPSVKYQDIYLYWGLHFSTLKRPSQKSDHKIFNAMLAAFLGWLRHYKNTKRDEIKRNCRPILYFIANELSTGFAPENLAKLKAQMKARLRLDFRQLPSSDEADSLRTRGVINL